ncbi:SpoIIIAH-like family protein [Bacillus solimangrovi]|uniref:Stage III sporulation protein AH n=1 Tax=Bacillus solimangrovi TaxID=1305675 RepID=A0A1E5LKC5_9BACI|nr:SpoIIIAH-like family protein [Bacillus solimangrovi]OEH94486.1 hypothetical protein BFG57_07375 [Bacillus solimangrovi]
MLKKQTVWLLTMLSLVVVLGVYYVTAPQPANEEFAAMQEQSNEIEQQMDMEQEGSESVALEGESSENSGIETVVEELGQEMVTSDLTTDEFFINLRMTINDERNKIKEQLNTVAASANVSSEEKSKALDEINYLTKLSAKEEILETMIKADERFSDVVVKTDEDKVRVIVRAQEPSESAANELMHLVRDELGLTRVAVEFQAIN